MPSKNLRIDSEWVSESLSHVWLFAAPWTKAYQASLPMEFPRQEYWSGLPFPSFRNLFHPRIEPLSPTLAGGFFTAEPPEDSECWTNFKSPLTPQSSHSHVFPRFLISTVMEMANHRVIQIALFLLQCQPCHESCFCVVFSAVSRFLPSSPSHSPPTSSSLSFPRFFLLLLFFLKHITSFFLVTFIFVYQDFLFSHLCSLGTSNCMVKVPAGNAQN